MEQLQPVATVTNTPTPQIAAITYAGFGSRLLAAFIDGFILGIFNMVIGLVVGIPVGIMTANNPDNQVLAGMIGMVVQLMTLIINYAYFIYFIGKNGQTLGKKAMKIQVVNIDTHQPPGYANAFLREIIGKLISAIILGIGYLWMLWDPNKQTLHDKIAHTIVIKV